jgi:hypothetical protein
MSKGNGRYYVKDIATGRTFVVEAIGRTRTDFGDSIQDHCKGSIAERDSVITSDRCANIGYSRNPMDYIDRLLRRA